MSKALFALPILAFALVAAKPAVVTPALPSIAAPAEVAANPANTLDLELSNGGKVVIQMRPDLAPNHVERIQTLVRQGFYNGLKFHRVIPGFMILPRWNRSIRRPGVAMRTSTPFSSAFTWSPI